MNRLEGISIVEMLDEINRRSSLQNLQDLNTVYDKGDSKTILLLIGKLLKEKSRLDNHLTAKHFFQNGNK